MNDTAKKLEQELAEELETMRRQVSELEQALQRAQARQISKEDSLFLAIVNQAPFSIWASKCKAGNYEIVLWNRGAEEIYGHSKEEAIGSNYLTLFVSPEESRQSAIDCDRILDGKVFRNFLAYDQAKDGTRRAVLTNCFRIFDEEEGRWLQAEMALEVPELASVIEENRQIREAGLRQLAQVSAWIALLTKLRSVTVTITSSLHEEQGLVPVLAQIVQSVNRIIYESVEGFTEKDVASVICVSKDEQQGLENPVCVISTEDLSGKSQLQSDEVYLGSYAIMHKAPLFIDSDHALPVGLIASIGSTTAVLPIIYGSKALGVLFVELKKKYVFTAEVELALTFFAEQAAIAVNTARLIADLRKMNQQVAEKEAIITRSIMAMDYVHRMNNLAGAIPTWVSFIRNRLYPSDPRDQQIEKYLNAIDRDTQDLLLEAESLRMPPHQEDVDVKLMLEGMLNNVTFRYPEISVVSEVDDDLHAIRAIRPEVADAVWNLISNALEAMSKQQARGVLTVGARNVSIDGKPWVRIDIIDTGVGIPADQRKRVFDLDFSTKGPEHGYGLWRTRQVVDRMGGHVFIESELNVGTTSTLLLPATPSG